MNRLLNIIIACFAMMELASCGQTAGETAVEHVDAIEVEDNLIPDTASAIDEKDAPKVATNYKFETPSEAIEFMQNSGNWESYSEGILPQMADDCLKYAQKLLNSPYDRFIVVDKHRMRVILFDKYGREEKSYKMACAKNYGSKHQKADSRTPEGFFSAQGVYDSTDWLFTDDNGVTSKKKGQFGPRFIRLKTPVTSQIGIHGTCAPWSIGARCSHGCIRIKNEQILELIEYVEVGMPIIVSPSLKDTKVNMAEGYDIPWISTNGKPIYKYEYVDTIKQDSIIDTLKIDSVVGVNVQIDSMKVKDTPRADSINPQQDIEEIDTIR